MTPLEELYVTVPGLPPHEEVMQYVNDDLEYHVQGYLANASHSTPKRRLGPLWALLCILIGAALLVGSGVLMFLLTIGVFA